MQVLTFNHGVRSCTLAMTGPVQLRSRATGESLLQIDQCISLAIVGNERSLSMRRSQGGGVKKLPGSMSPALDNSPCLPEVVGPIHVDHQRFPKVRDRVGPCGALGFSLRI